MSKIEQVKKFITNPTYPLQDRLRATQELISSPMTLFLCQQSVDSEVVLTTQPLGFIHARLDCVTDNPNDLEKATFFDIKYIEINAKSNLVVQLYRDYGATKCKTVPNDQDQLSKPFNEIEEIFHTLRLLPMALILGQWDRIG